MGWGVGAGRVEGRSFDSVVLLSERNRSTRIIEIVYSYDIIISGVAVKSQRGTLKIRD